MTLAEGNLFRWHGLIKTDGYAYKKHLNLKNLSSNALVFPLEFLIF